MKVRHRAGGRNIGPSNSDLGQREIDDTPDSGLSFRPARGDGAIPSPTGQDDPHPPDEEVQSAAGPRSRPSASGGRDAMAMSHRTDPRVPVLRPCCTAPRTAERAQAMWRAHTSPVMARSSTRLGMATGGVLHDIGKALTHDVGAQTPSSAPTWPEVREQTMLCTRSRPPQRGECIVAASCCRRRRDSGSGRRPPGEHRAYLHRGALEEIALALEGATSFGCRRPGDPGGGADLVAHRGPDPGPRPGQAVEEADYPGVRRVGRESRATRRR